MIPLPDRTIIDDLYELTVKSVGERTVAVWGTSEDWDTTTVVPAYTVTITVDGYHKMKQDLEEYHNILAWMNLNPEYDLIYHKSEVIRILKS